MFVRQHTPSSRVSRVFAFSPFDVICAAAAPVAAILLRDSNRLLEGDWFGFDVTYCVISFIVTLVVFAAFRISDPLTRYFSMEDIYRVVWAAAASVALSGILLFLVTRLETASRSAFLLHFVLLTSALVFGRLVSRSRDMHKRKAVRSIREREQGRQNTLVIGVHPATAPLLRFLEDYPDSPINVVALLDQRKKHAGRTVFGYRVAGTPAALGDILKEYEVHGIEISRLLVAGPKHALDAATRDAIKTAQTQLNLSVSYAGDLLAGTQSPDATAMTTEHAGQSADARLSLVDPNAQLPEKSANLDPALLAFKTTGGYWRIKRAVDILVASLLAIAILPVMAVVAVFVAIEMGIPVIFWQQRVGRNRRPIMVYKFRTLRAPYDRYGNQRDEADRLGTVGVWLRRTRLDELPQLWNVIIGDMSLIGPRPLLPIDLPQSDDTRLLVRPGLTGWAQVNGGKLLSVTDKNLLDKWYIAHASAWVDLKTTLKTLIMMLLGEKNNEAALAIARRWAEHQTAAPSATTEHPQPPNEATGTSNVVPLSKDRAVSATAKPGTPDPSTNSERSMAQSDPSKPNSHNTTFG